MERTYEDAICCLNSRKAKAKANLNGMRGSDDMVEWLSILGYSIEALNGLNIIHIAGTKGKGSTCAFVTSFLEVHGAATGYPRKIGHYSSPHMKDIRERIRINGVPISKKLFTIRFFEVWDKLPHYSTPTLDIPRYLQLLALLSFHVFAMEKVDVAVYETHSGGEFDATNVIKAPIVTAITSIAMDHVKLLGPTIEDIAWHKAGILKFGSRAFSTLQESAVTAVLQQRAVEKDVVVDFIGIDPALPVKEALKPKLQRTNCSLAVAVVRAWLSIKAPQAHVNIDTLTRGVDHFFWPGRYQQINDHNCQWFLDGANNELSMRYAVQWFAELVQNNNEPPPRILIFSHFSERDGTVLLRCIADCLQDNKLQIQHVILSTYDERRDGRTKIDRNLKNRFSPEVQEHYACFWKTLDPQATVSCERTIEGALHRAKTIGANVGMQTLVTGSLHLISGALCLLEAPMDMSSDNCSQRLDVLA